jgi:putative phosphoesterase
VGVVSDTHWRGGGRAYPEVLLRGLQGVDLILHAGDLVTLAALEPLWLIAPVVAVAGNVDEMAVRAALPDRRVVQIGPYRVGLTHGHRGVGRNTPERALTTFEFVPLDAVVFGHSHEPLCEERDGVLLFNPGSPTDRRFQPEFSFGILHAAERLWGEIRRFR